MERSIIVAPSVLSADFSDIRGALSEIRNSGTSWVHLDVMESTEYVRLWYNGITSALQAEDAGSTPVGR